MNDIVCPYCGSSEQVEEFIFEFSAIADMSSGGVILCHTCEKHLPTYKRVMTQASFDIVHKQLWEDFYEWRELFFELVDDIEDSCNKNHRSKELEKRRDLLLYLSEQLNYAQFGM